MEHLTVCLMHDEELRFRSVIALLMLRLERARGADMSKSEQNDTVSVKKSNFLPAAGSRPAALAGAAVGTAPDGPPGRKN